MRTVITLPDHLHAEAKQRAAQQGISFAEFARRLFDRELSTADPQGDLDAIRAIVHGEPFDMAADCNAIVAEAVAAQHRQHLD
ncbi:hypothetical protein [Candidatus Poriferisodalis sp.]|uniref:hypothetical protein n=1 Tax=Candidatus Poriferisodalis sp. TaxID=3101277 RepID=UPI003B02DA1C